jgi:Holliday junction resolvase RusA-like endonuclease
MSAFVRGGRPIVTDQKGSKLKPWREAVRSTAVDAAGEAWAPIDGPVRVDLWFAMPKPQSVPKTRRTWPMRKPDLDKLARACLDALTQAGILADDARVVELRAVKDWPEHVQQMSPGVVVRVWRVDPTLPPPTTGQIPLLGEPITGGPTE